MGKNHGMADYSVKLRSKSRRRQGSAPRTGGGQSAHKVSEPVPPAGDKMVLALGMKIHLRAGVVVVAVVDLQDEADEPGKVVSKKQVHERWIELQLSRPFAA